MQNTSTDLKLREKSYFYYICYYSLYLDLLIAFFNPFNNFIRVFSNPIEYSFYASLLFCLTYKSLYFYVNKFKKKRLPKYKVEGIFSRFLKKVLGLFLFFLISAVIYSLTNDSLNNTSKVKIFAVLFLIGTTLFPLITSVFKRGSKVNKNLFKNGIYFNLACFCARWVSLSSALIMPFYEYGELMFASSFLLAFYFMHTFLGVDEKDVRSVSVKY